MRRDPEIIRQILLNAEDDKYPYGGVVHLDGVSREECAYHAALIIDAGLAVGQVIPSLESPYAAAMIHRLTAAGHDFCDGIRDVTIWSKAKDHVVKHAVPWTLSLLAEWVKGELQRRLLGDPPRS